MKVLAVMPGKKPVKMELDGTLESMQTFVGGTIQAVYPFDDPVAIVCNEEGKLLEWNTTVPSTMNPARSTISFAVRFLFAVWVRMILHHCLKR